MDSGGTDKVQASFGSTTTVGESSGQHVSISPTAVEIKTDANTTVLSASAAGLEMQGKVRANSGTIGGFSITRNAISSSNNSLILKGEEGQITSSAAKITKGDIGGFTIDDFQLISAPLILDSGRGANIQYGGEDGTGIVYGGKPQRDLYDNMANETGSFWIMAGQGTDAEMIVFRVGVQNTFIKLLSEEDSDNGTLEISSSNFTIASNGDVSMTGEINATAGTIGPINLGSDGLTGLASTFNGTSSIDDTTINLVTRLGTPGGPGSLSVNRFLSIQSGKVVEACATHYKGSMAAHSTINGGTGLSDAWIGVHRDMKETHGWFQDTYMGNNFGNTGKYSFIQIQIDTGSGETYNGGLGDKYNPLHGGLHGSTGIHMGFGTSQFSTVAQAPMGSSYLGNTNLSLFANGNISGSNSSIFSGGTLLASSVVRSHGDVVAFYSSDERLKDNIRTIEEPIYKLRQLRGVEYEWNDKQNTYASGSLDSGIIAQDVQKVLPQLVKERNDGHLGVRHDRLVGLLIEAIKDQQDQIDEMKDQIKELKDGSS